MSSRKPPFDPHDLESRLRRLEALHRALGEEITALRLMQQEYGLGNFQGTYQPPTPYNRPAEAKPASSNKVLAKRMEAPPTKEQFEEARRIIMDGYILDRPEDGDRMLKTLVFRILDGSTKGFKSADLPSARIVAMYLIEQVGLNPGPGFRASKLRSLLKKYVHFEPIASIRRLPR